jgi:hypothetical protein
MRFYSQKPNLVVWDAENECNLMKFVKGVYDTTDKHVQDKLIALGYKHDAPDPPKDPLEGVVKVSMDMKAPDIREIGRRNGLKFKIGTSKEDMVKAINEKV